LVICRVDFKSATGGNESRAALLPGKVSGRRGATILRPLVDGSMRYDAVNAMLLNGFLFVSDCVVIPCNPRQEIVVSKIFCNAGKSSPKEKVKGPT